jgi:hypothetical protein
MQAHSVDEEGAAAKWVLQSHMQANSVDEEGAAAVPADASDIPEEGVQRLQVVTEGAEAPPPRRS